MFKIFKNEQNHYTLGFLKDKFRQDTVYEINSGSTYHSSYIFEIKAK